MTLYNQIFWFVSGSSTDEWSPLFASVEAAREHANRLGYCGNYAILMIDAPVAEASAMAAQRHHERLNDKAHR